jgi:F-type H+-transporting ATPase subunit alpha
LFNAGVRPAINVGLSVSRVGGAAQTKAMKKVAGKLRLELAQFKELEAFAQFASDLDPATQRQITRGRKSVKVLIQDEFSPLTVGEEVSLIFAAGQGILDSIDDTKITEFKKGWFEYFAANHKTLKEKLDRGDSWDDDIVKELLESLNKFKENLFL